MEVLAKRLKWLRERERLSQKEVAAKIGMTVSGYQKIEYGERDPKLDVLIKLAELYDASVDFLLGISDRDKFLNEMSKEIIATKTLLAKIKREMMVRSFNLGKAEEEYQRFKELQMEATDSFKYREMYLEYLRDVKGRLEFELHEIQESYRKKMFNYIEYILEIPECKPYKDEIIKMIAPVHLDIQLNLFGNYTLFMSGKDGYLYEYETFETEELAVQKCKELLKLLNGI
jgi:transcriptional regulator with XRE-family HTH domain